MRRRIVQITAWRLDGRQTRLGLAVVFLAVLSWPANLWAERLRSGDLFSDPAYDALREAFDGGEKSSSPVVNHPLLPALRYAYVRYERMHRNVRDYTCIVYRRERITGKLRSHEAVAAKVRHRQVVDDRILTPFSVYLRYLGPSRVMGREALFVETKYFGRLIVTLGGDGGLSNVTLALNPHGSRAMAQNRYPIDRFGIMDTARQLIERGISEMRFDRHPDEWEVRFLQNAKIDDRGSTCIQVRRTVHREEYSFYLIRVFIDDELQVPVRYTSFSWPRTPGGGPMLDEEYTYTNVRLNVGLSDVDFEPANPRYGFDEDRIVPREDATASVR